LTASVCCVKRIVDSKIEFGQIGADFFPITLWRLFVGQGNGDVRECVVGLDLVAYMLRVCFKDIGLRKLDVCCDSHRDLFVTGSLRCPLFKHSDQLYCNMIKGGVKYKKHKNVKWLC